MARASLNSLGLLALRLGVGGMLLFQHGLPKLLSFSEKVGTFADPIGVGRAASLTLAIFAEAVCSGLIMLGLGTRAAAIPVAVTMLVAAFAVHGDDPFEKKELALLYLVPALTLIAAGPGRWSLDALVGRRKKRPSLL